METPGKFFVKACLSSEVPAQLPEPSTQEALRKAAADLPDKPKVSDAVFSKILLLMKWKRT